jgi:hypothetical protein
MLSVELKTLCNVEKYMCGLTVLRCTIHIPYENILKHLSCCFYYFNKGFWPEIFKPAFSLHRFVMKSISLYSINFNINVGVLLFYFTQCRVYLSYMRLKLCIVALFVIVHIHTTFYTQCVVCSSIMYAKCLRPVLCGSLVTSRKPKYKKKFEERSCCYLTYCNKTFSYQKLHVFTRPCTIP